MGFLEKADLLGRGAGERALRVTEQLRLDQVLGQRRAVDLDERALAPGRTLVQGVGDQLLAGAALADDQHVGVRVGHRGDRLQHALDPGGGAEDLAVGGLLEQPPTQLGVLDQQLAVLERVLDEPQHLLGLERLLHHVERAGALGGLHRLAHRAIGRDDDDLQRRIAALQLLGQHEAVAVRQHEVHDRHLGVRLRDGRQRGADRARDPHRVALRLQREAQAVGDRRFVVDDQDGVPHAHAPAPPAGGGGGSSGSRTLTRVPLPSVL